VLWRHCAKRGGKEAAVHEHERLSAKMAKFRPSLTLALKRLAENRQAAGLPVWDFGLGETKGALNTHIREAGEAAFRQEQTMYTDPAGMPELRQAVLSWLDLEREYTIDNVVVTAGAKQSLFNIFLAVCNPGDVVLFDAAPWVSYQPLAAAAYATPVMVLPAGGDATRLKVTPGDLRRNLKFRPYTRLFLLNNPVNPTGQFYEAEEVEGLLRLCVEHQIYFVLDRLYWRILFDGRRYPDPTLDEATKPWVIQVDGMSKNFRRAGGLRIGWSVAPEDVARAMANLQSHYTSGPATPTQRTALAALTHTYDTTLAEELQARRDLFLKESEGIPGVAIWPTPATFYSFWDVRGLLGKRTPSGRVLRDSDDVTRYLLKQAGVVVASGAGFFCDGYLRLCFATPEETVVGGMRAAREALSALRD
jgi:aspartate aminotransferase